MSLALLAQLAWLLVVGSGEHWRLVAHDGSVRQVDRQLLPTDVATEDSADDEPAVVRGWGWSDFSAPVRFRADELPAAELPRQRARLEIDLDHLRRSERLGMTVIAAPLAMWKEVPEPLLPSWRVTESGNLHIPLDPAESWRLRWIGESTGSWWTDLPPGKKKVRLARHPVSSHAFAILDEAGNLLPKAFLRVLKGHSGRPDGVDTWATYQGEKERILLPALPNGEEITLVAWAPDRVPKVLRGWPASLPKEIELLRGATINGRFVDAHGEPVARVDVKVEAWLAPGFPRTHVRRARSDDGGYFKVESVPPGEVMVLGWSPRFVAFERAVEIVPEAADLGDVDLGDIVLRQGSQFEVRVTDVGGIPIAGARVDAGVGRWVISDHEGIARIERAPNELPLKLEVGAEGFRSRTLSLQPPHAGRFEEVELQRSFTLSGRLAVDDGASVKEGWARVFIGSRTFEERLGYDGRFELELDPGEEIILELLSPETEALRRIIPEGEPGEIRDLGELTASRGLIVRGRVVSGEDGSPLMSAHVWVPRPSPRGSLTAWVHQDLLTTRSDEAGRFELGGLPRQPGELRVDVPGFARSVLSFEPGEEEKLDLGEIQMEKGATIEVTLEEPTGGESLARLDLRNRWLEMDMLTAPVVEGRSVFHNVPAGRVTISVLDDGSLICEEAVDVEAGLMEVPCRASEMEVRGVVMAGSEIAGPGRLIWRRPVAGVFGSIMNYESPHGLRQQTTFGAGRPSVIVKVGEGSDFATAELRSGSWEVLWSPHGAAPSEPVSISLSREPFQEIVIEVPGSRISGVVLDEDGEPREGARIEALGRGTLGFHERKGGSRSSASRPEWHIA